MAENIIPITYFVDAQAIAPQQGLDPLQNGTILLLTDEEPAKQISTPYVISRTSSNIANIWGTETEVAKQAAAIFSQQPNILIGGGYLIVAPYRTVTPDPAPATAGRLTTPNLSTNIANFADVTNGALTITVNGGEAQEITELDFTGAATLEEIANVITAKIEGATITVIGNDIVFTSNTTGADSSIALEPTMGAGITDIYGTDYLSGENAVEVQGTDEVQPEATPETLTQAIARLSKLVYFEGILTTRNVSDSEFLEASNFVQSLNNRVMPLPRTISAAIAGVFSQTQNNYNTKNIYYGLGDSEIEISQNARIFAAAYLSRALAVNYSGSNTTLTMNLKTLTGIAADTTVDETLLAELKTVGADCYPSVEGLAKVTSNSQGGYFFDQVTNSIWFVNAIKRAVFNTIATIGTKIAQTETGLQQIADSIQDVCKQAVENGFLAPGTWNGADTFGNYDDFMRNIREYGYYQYHQPIAQQSQSEREQRQAPFWQIAGKEAGAIHNANILIYIEA